MLAPAFHNHADPVPVIKTIASQKKGVEELAERINEVILHKKDNEKKYWLLAEKACYLIQQKRMSDIDKKILKEKIKNAGSAFNLYRFIRDY